MLNIASYSPIFVSSFPRARLFAASLPRKSIGRNNFVFSALITTVSHLTLPSFLIIIIHFVLKKNGHLQVVCVFGGIDGRANVFQCKFIV